MTETRLSAFLSFWRQRSPVHKLELVALVLLWVMIFVAVANFDYLPIVEIDGRYYAKAHGIVSYVQARPYILIEYAFWSAAGLYVLARVARWTIVRHARHAQPASRNDA